MSPEEFWSFNSSPKALRRIGELASVLQIDPKALRIFFNTKWDFDGREGSGISYSIVPAADLLHAQASGFFQTPDYELSHDEVISQVIAARDKLDQRKLVAAFANSLVSRRLDHRSALGSYAHSLQLPLHPFTLKAERTACHVCHLASTNKITPDYALFRRIMWAGNVEQGDLRYVLCDLQAFTGSATDVEASASDILRQMFAAIEKLPAQAGLSDLEKSISKLFPSNKHERQVVLEILGYCGILRPKNTPSLHEQWINRHEVVEPTHFFRREWRTPVSCWYGRDGVDWEAVKFWFGDLG